MTWIVIVSLIGLFVIVFFGWSNNHAKKQHAAFTKSDVIRAIENVFTIDYYDEWDLFLAWPIKDIYLESIRQKCILICADNSGKEKGKDIGTVGEIQLQSILDELKRRA